MRKQESSDNKIKTINARQVFDSRGNPTLYTQVVLDSGHTGVSVVPSGASTGSKEALELRDNGNRFNGKSVYDAADKINSEISSHLRNISIENQRLLDQRLIDLDGTENKERLGANTILGVSMAFARAASAATHEELTYYLREQLSNDPDSEWGKVWEDRHDDARWLGRNLMPVPMFNVLNGGSHAFNSTDFQEYMVVPVGIKYFEEAMHCGFKIYNELKKILESKNLPTTVGDEGGFSITFGENNPSNIYPLELLMEAIEKSNYEPGKDVMIALDVAASEMFEGKDTDGSYLYKFEGGKFSSNQMIMYYEELTKKFPIYSIEDGLDENDWDGWKKLTTLIGDRVQLVGDDLFVTQRKLLKEGIKDNVANSILIKLNQIGTVTETLDTITEAQKNNYSTIISHRSGETEDTFIADLALATHSSQIKSGAPARGERVNKYNRLLVLSDCLSFREYFEYVGYDGQRIARKILNKNRMNAYTTFAPKEGGHNMNDRTWGLMDSKKN